MELDLYNALVIFTLLNLLDIITTYNVIRKVGATAEANPVARYVIERMGVAGLFALKYFVMGVVVLVGWLQNALAHSIWINNVILSFQLYRLDSALVVVYGCANSLLSTLSTRFIRPRNQRAKLQPGQLSTLSTRFRGVPDIEGYPGEGVDFQLYRLDSR